MGFKLPNWKDINSLSDIGQAAREVIDDVGEYIDERSDDIEDTLTNWYEEIKEHVKFAEVSKKGRYPRSTRHLVNQFAVNEWIPVVYGSVKLGGYIPFLGVSGTNKENYHIVLVLCEGEIDAINNIYIDDIRADDDKFLNTDVAGNKYTTGTISATNGSKVLTGSGTTWSTNVAVDDIISFDKSYSTGTVSVTNGGKIVTGSGTLWLDNVLPDNKIVINSVTYQISSIDTNTQLILSSNYTGSTNSGLSYSINFVETPFYFVASVDSNTQITLDTEYLGTTGSGKTYVRRKSFVKAYKYRGTTTQAADSILTANFSDIGYTSTAQGKGIAYVHVVLNKKPTVFSKQPRINCDVRGKKCFDPRDSTTKYTTNPIIIARDYTSSTIYGAKIPSSDIDDTLAGSAADYCDETITEYTGGGNIKRFEFNGIVETDKEPFDNLRNILNHCWGKIYNINGKYRFKVMKAETASFTFNEDNIIGEIIIEGSSKETRLNTVRAKYRNPKANWQDDIYVLSSSTYLTEDGGLELEEDIDFPNETNQYRIRYHAEIALKQSRKTMRVSFTAFPEAFSVEEGNVVNLTYAAFGWTNKKFRAVVITLLPSFLVACVLQEHDDAVYDRTSPDQITSIPGTRLYNARDVPAPTGLTVTSNDAANSRNADGTIQYHLQVSWTAIPNVNIAYYEVQVKNSTDSTWKEYITVVGTEVFIPVKNYYDKYDVRVLGVNVHDSKSPYTTSTNNFLNVDSRIHYQNNFDNLDKLEKFTPSGGSISLTTNNEIRLQVPSTSGNQTQVYARNLGGRSLKWNRKFSIRTSLKIDVQGDAARINETGFYTINTGVNGIGFYFINGSGTTITLNAICNNNVGDYAELVTANTASGVYYDLEYRYYPGDKIDFYVNNVLSASITSSETVFFPSNTSTDIDVDFLLNAQRGSNTASTAYMYVDRVVIYEF